MTETRQLKSRFFPILVSIPTLGMVNKVVSALTLHTSDFVIELKLRGQVKKIFFMALLNNV
jgi:hypothetical protein